MSGRISAATEEALRLVQQGYSKYRAAKMAHVAESTVYRALERLEAEQRVDHMVQQEQQQDKP